ncbi:beta-ketoacyl-[acyl-carrier-protein] synthase family protein [Janthinobacterium sp. NFX145]|uniref:beta-ketoacyl-[acyl-carrier-protein] synthase family protein n=1 Tax=Janthinobacterium sp. NFX145 TaxID=3415602 RepID=UPI003CC5C44C
MTGSHMAAQRRVVVTGMGVVSAAGNDLASYWDSLRSGRSGVAALSREGEQWCATAQEPVRLIGAQVSLPAARAVAANISPESIDDFARFALHAAEQAMRQAGFDYLMENREEVGVVLGTAMGGEDARNLAGFRVYVKRRPPAPQTLIRAMANAGASTVSMAFGLQGPSHSVVSACASATHAIGQAYQMIRAGLADVMLAGGSEQLPSYSLYSAWRQMRVLSPDACRPFGADRNGMVLGEGAGVLVLETLASARARGATILGEICGFAMNASAADWTRPDSASMARCIARAVKSAGLDVEQVGFVIAHGTGTLLNDAAESEAIHAVFGRHGASVPVSGGKAIHGHALGATGALECISALLALEHGVVPPIGAPHIPDPASRLNIVHGTAIGHGKRHALCNSFAFGGLNGVLAVGRHDGEP